MTWLKPIWRIPIIVLGSKIRLKLALVMSVFLYASETWTLTMQAMVMSCYWKIMRITCTHHVCNVDVRNRIQHAIGRQEDLQTTVKRRKLKWYGHIARSSGLEKNIFQGLVKHGEGSKKKGKTKEAMDFAPARWPSAVVSLCLNAKTLKMWVKRKQVWIINSHM